MLKATPPPDDQERGATAVLVAILSLVLLGVGAVAVDMGQVYAKRASLQTNVDLAVLAAAAELNGTGSCTTQAKAAASRFLTLAGNEVDLQRAVNLNDGDRSNGQMICSGWTVKLFAPSARVNFGLAKALSPDNDGVDVPASAEAAVYSPKGRGIMPAFVAPGCDYGEHTLVPDFSAGGTSVPPLREGNPIDPRPRPANMNPQYLRPGTTGATLTIRGRALGGVNQVGFTTALNGANLHEETIPLSVANRTIRVRVPLEVRTTAAQWFVRVSRDGGTTWTQARLSLRLTVSDLVLKCDTGPTNGDFGTLAAPRRANLGSTDNVSANLARGLDFSVTKFPNPGPGWQCSGGSGGAVSSSPGSLNDLTNCVSVDAEIGTGLSADGAERGLLIGGPSRARLARGTTSGCGSSLRIRFGSPIGTRRVNNDTLDCFVKSGATNSFQSSNYAGSAVIKGSIFMSPRFFWVPVLGTSAAAGGQYQIVDFRPAFLTGPTGGNNFNGFTLPWRGGRRSLEGVRLVFFNPQALPESVADVPIMDYLGVGTKVISLVD